MRPGSSRDGALALGVMPQLVAVGEKDGDSSRTINEESQARRFGDEYQWWGKWVEYRFGDGEGAMNERRPIGLTVACWKPERAA